jgi:hypothetical protein
MLHWLSDPEHLLMILGLILFHQSVRRMNAILERLSAFHSDYRKVLSLDEIDQAELQSRMDAEIDWAINLNLPRHIPRGRV